MKRKLLKTRFFAVLVALCCSLGLVAQQRSASGSANHVVIITLDGFPGWALDDPYLPVPILRRLVARGAVAGGMRSVNPTVTWPNHTAIITGVTAAKHGVLFNGVLVRDPGVPPRIEPWRDKKEMVRVPTLYDVVHEKGMTTAQVDWVAILNAATINWEFAERPERPETKPAIMREMVKAGELSQADLDAFAAQNIVWKDEVWTNAAVHILREHRPNLSLFHLLALDSMQHRYGPRTPAAMVTMAYLDSQVAKIVKALEDTGMMPRTTIFVLSDHGFKAVKKHIFPNTALKNAGLLTVEGGKITQTQVYSLSEGGTALVYVTVPDPGGDILQRARQALAGVEGIDKIVEPADYASYGLPQPSDNPQVGALFLTAKSGYSFLSTAGDKTIGDALEGSLGAHGYVATDPDLQALFIASGRGIKAGVKLGTVENIDVAPTAARLLGVNMKNVDGKVLTEILSSPVR